MVTENLPGISYHDQVKDFGSLLPAVGRKWRECIFLFYFFPLEPLFCFIDPSLDFPS